MCCVGLGMLLVAGCGAKGDELNRYCCCCTPEGCKTYQQELVGYPNSDSCDNTSAWPQVDANIVICGRTPGAGGYASIEAEYNECVNNL